MKKQMRKQRRMNGPMADMVRMGATNLVGVGMIGATAGMVAGMPAGTAKTVAGVVPGLQSAALVGANLKYVPGMRRRRRK